MAGAAADSEPHPQPACPVCPYGVTSRCAGFDPDAPSSWETERVIGCLDPARQIGYYRDLHRRDFEAEPPPPPALPPLPAFIPVLVRVIPAAARLPRLPVYGVSYTTVLRNTGEVRYGRPQDLRRQLGLAPDAQVGLIGTAKDARLEQAWAVSETRQLWRRLAALSFRFATTTTFSVWERQPRFDQIYNQERNLYSYARFARLGIPTVPFLFYRTAADFEAAVAWLKRRREVGMIAVLAQFYRRTEDFERLLGDMRAMTEAVERPLRLLVTGCATAAKIERLFALFPGATVVSTQPVMQALHGNAIGPGLEPRKAGRATSRAELLAINISRFTKLCAAARPLSELPA